MLRSLQVEHVVLVTSDTHMLRSLCTFRAAGIESIPAIARNPHADQPRRTRIGPSDRGLQAFGALAHEVLGIGVLLRARLVSLLTERRTRSERALYIRGTRTGGAPAR